MTDKDKIKLFLKAKGHNLTTFFQGIGLNPQVLRKSPKLQKIIVHFLELQNPQFHFNQNEKMKAKDLFYKVADIKYPKNEAGGTGSLTISDLNLSHEESDGGITLDTPRKELMVSVKTYGCGYNAPYIKNQDEVKKALEEIGYELSFE